MPIDLFGQSTEPLPVPTDKYRRGPDWQKGCPKCRQQQVLCETGQPAPHDHSCCCDPCRHDFINVCTGDEDGPHGCCRCSLKAICMIFTPDSLTENCTPASWKLPRTTVTQKGVKYSINHVEMGIVTLFAGFPEPGNPLYGIAACIWQLTAPDLSVDESVAIDHSGAIHCQAPPDWTIEGVTITRHGESCTGTVSFAEYELTKLPFISRWWDFPEEYVNSQTCGSCIEFCQILCVRRGDDASHTRVEFIWNDASLHWLANDGTGHFIILYEENGNCYFKLDSVGGTEFEDDLILIDPAECSLGMDLTATGTGTNFFSISCNRCSCWKYICGNCRCICTAMCIVRNVGGILSRFDLTWDQDNWRWGTDAFYILLGEGENRDCEGTIGGTEFDSTSNSNSASASDTLGPYGGFPIRNDCGSRIAFSVSISDEEAIASGVIDYVYGFCTQCVDSCDQGSCLELCGDVPSLLQCEVSATEWTAMLGCNPSVLCFETIIIPLALVFVVTEATPAGEWRWLGCGIIACHDCSPPTAPKNYLVCVDVGCDGVGLFTVSHPDASVNCSEQFGFTLPCGVGAVWDIEHTTDTACGDGLNGCCDEGGFHIRITE